MLKRLFTEHPASVGETYLEHMRFASATGATMIAGGAACLVHGVLPFLCVTTGSRTIRKLATRIANTALRGHPKTVRVKPEELKLLARFESLTSASL
ncbi:MAG TPA: DUF6356 family protein [Stellaceae bacterium]|nr:DUF6356 family protein [Stellaceae bacterium]